MPVKDVKGVREVIDALYDWDKQKRRDLEGVAKREIEPMLERYAKSNRPWKDRTGRARQGLTASSEMTASELVLRLSHTVPYGVFLELASAGKYAILGPTMDANRAALERILKRFWEE